MSENSKIEWTDHTFNPWEGCAKVSPGCANCYAEARNSRWNGGTAPNWGKGKPRRRTSAANWRKPLQWNRQAGSAGERPRVFCASLADWLDDEVPIEWLVDLLILIRETPHLDWLLLTKRPENFFGRIEKARISKKGFEESDLWLWLDEWMDGEPPENVWIGTTVEDQKRADERIPLLFEIPAAIRFLSCEPLLESVDLIGKDIQGSALHPYQNDPKIDWVIAGGESGSG